MERSRRAHITGVTQHPQEAWMVQMGRSTTMGERRILGSGNYLIHDRDGKFRPASQRTNDVVGVKRLPGPTRSPNLNAYTAGWVCSIAESHMSLLTIWEKNVLTVWRLDRLGLSPLGPALPSGLYGEHEGKNAKHCGDEERWRQCWDLAHTGGIAQIEAMA